MAGLVEEGVVVALAAGWFDDEVHFVQDPRGEDAGARVLGGEVLAGEVVCRDDSQSGRI